MAGRLQDKVAIVTGATCAVGRAIAALFISEGAKVVVAGRSESRGAQLELDLKKLGGDVLFVRTDVTKLEELQYLVNATTSHFGRVDVLVNNAVENEPDDACEQDTPSDYEDVFSVGVKSYLVMCREVLPYMIRQQKGSIINTASVVGESGFSGIASVAASKGAVKAFTRSLAAEYADQGVRINSIMLGLTETDRGAENELDAKVACMVPMGRAATPEEIAYGFLFFASEESSFCTGSNLVIDGGTTAK